MKKLIILLSFILVSTNMAFAACPYSNKCAAPQNQHKSLGVTRFLSRATGSTYFAEKAAQKIIKAELKKQTGADFNVGLKAFSAPDLLNGTFESLNLSGNNIVVGGNYISKLNVNTECNYNSVNYKAKPIKFRENMVLKASVVMTDSDIKNSLKNGGVLDKLNSINLSGFGVSFFKVDNSTIDIKNGKLYFTVKTTAFGIPKPFNISVSADIKVENGKIITSKVALVNLFSIIDLQNYTYLLNKLDPLTFKLPILDNPQSEIKIQKIELIGDKIYLDTYVFLPKN